MCLPTLLATLTLPAFPARRSRCVYVPQIHDSAAVTGAECSFPCWRSPWHQLTSDAKFEHVTSRQPLIANFGDYILDISNSLSSQLLSNLALVLTYSYNHEAVPPPGAVKDDQRLGVLLTVAL